MRRVYISAFGSGLGHAARMLVVARALSGPESSVHFSSSGDAVELIRRSGFPCSGLPLVDVSWGDDGGFSALGTARNFPVLLSRFALQVGAEAGIISGFRPTAVLSDSMPSAILASRLSGTRVVTVVNQLRLESSPRTPRTASRMISAGSVTVVDRLWGLSDEILLADLPPPYTISERNLTSAGRAASRGKYVGFLSPESQSLEDEVSMALARETRPIVYWQVSGPPATRVPLLIQAHALAESTKGDFVTVISAGNPAGSRNPQRTSFGWFYEWCEVKDRVLELAAVVVSRAGHSSVAQYLLREKPSLLIPIPAQTEQEGNALKAWKLGISLCLDQRKLTERSYRDAVTRLMDVSFRKRLGVIGAFARNFDAVSAIVDALS